ncbi:hypothetical protein GGI07_001253 [Coemansia sp. Benny D115]|nr:hypothetical protein GGI07_001253 [Coemansia sp. Benny D115]
MAANKRYSQGGGPSGLSMADAMKQQTYAQLVDGSRRSGRRESYIVDAREPVYLYGRHIQLEQQQQPIQKQQQQQQLTVMPRLGEVESPPPPSPRQLHSRRQHVRKSWRQSLPPDQQQQQQQQQHLRRSSMAPGSGYSQYGHQRHSMLAAASESAARKRMSLDSYQHAIVSRQIVNEHFEASGRANTFADDHATRAPMWSDEQLRRARRFSSTSHTRGTSCPTLNITRIMRSISVSSGGSSSASPAPIQPPLSRRQARRDLAAASRTSQATGYYATALRTTPLGSIRSSESHTSSFGDDSSLHRGDVGESIDQPPAHPSEAPEGTADEPEGPRRAHIPPRITVDGLRRRSAIHQRDTATPDVNIDAGDLAASPLSPPLTEDTTYSEIMSNQGEPSYSPLATLCSHRHPESASHSSSSSARWSTISADSPHKRYSYSSAAIAEALRNLQSVSRNSNILFDDLTLTPSSFAAPREGLHTTNDEAMTITLKGPPPSLQSPHIMADSSVHAAEALAHAECEKDQSNNSIEQPSSTRNVVDSNATLAQERPESHGMPHSEAWSQRESHDGGRSSDEVAIPAIYLDSTASLWDQYVAEMESSDFDSNIHLKRQRVSQFLRVPWNVEKLLWFGVAICFDALIYVFSIIPAKFVRASLALATALLFELPGALESIYTSALAQAMLGSLPELWRARLVEAGRFVRRWALSASGRGSLSSDRSDAASVTSCETMMRWLSPAQLFDFYRGILLIVTCAVLCRIDAAQMYHSIRAQSSLKLYFIFSALDIFDRLLSSFGHDVLDALQSTVTDPRWQRWRTGAGYFLLAQAYMLVHTLVLFYQVITLNVAVNAYSDQLLSLLISNQFVEIKSNVFKKWEKEMLFQVACADVVERFQEIVFLFIIIVRNLAELSGTGLSPLFAPVASAGAPPAVTAQSPVSFDSATPSAFGPLVPSWVSGPMVNRIITPVLMVLGTEIVIDWIKHAFITKLNWIRPEVYSHYIDILSRDLACSKPGVRTHAVPARRTGINDGVSADEKIECAETAAGTQTGDVARTGSSPSILAHATLKAVSWMQKNLLGDTDAATGTVEDGDRTSEAYGRRRGHQRVQSVTQPQLFVGQSSRVARRLGLSPMPLACLITLMLAQVAHILMQSSRPQYTETGTAALATAAGASSGGSPWLVAGLLTGIPLLGALFRVAFWLCRVVWLILVLATSLVFSWSASANTPHSSGNGGTYGALVSLMPSGWVVLDVLGWTATVLIVYVLVVWTKLSVGGRLMQFAWGRYRDFERRTSEHKGTEKDTSNLKRFDDGTKQLDRETFMEVGKLIGKERSEAEWEKRRPKWTMDNIERYSLFKSRVP